MTIVFMSSRLFIAALLACACGASASAGLIGSRSDDASSLSGSAIMAVFADQAVDSDGFPTDQWDRCDRSDLGKTKHRLAAGVTSSATLPLVAISIAAAASPFRFCTYDDLLPPPPTLDGLLKPPQERRAIPTALNHSALLI